MGDSLPKNINKKKTQMFYEHVDVCSKTNAIGYNTSSISMWNIIDQKYKRDFSCG